MIVYSSCPCCNSGKIAIALSAKDHTVSGETFQVWHCGNCTARFTQNVPDQAQINKYYKSEAYISHSDTQKGLINRMYHMVRKRTLAGKKKLVQKYTGLSAGKLLDIGAGTGAFLHTMNRSGWEVTGFEPDDTARENAKRLFGIRLQVPDELFQLAPQSFDAITLWHVLEHVHDLHLYMDQFKKLLKPSGVLIVAVPNYTSYDANVYRENWAAYDVPRHLYHFSPASVTQLLLQHGLQLHAIKPMWFDSFYVSMLSEKIKTGKNNLVSAAWTGYVSNWKAFFNPEKCSSIIYIIKS